MTKAKNQGQFADVYEGCQVVANLMGLNVETVRKRAKAGKIPAKQNERGTWVFSHEDLFRAGVEPFCSHLTHLTLKTISTTSTPKQNTTHVVFVLDRSGSMSGWEKNVRDNLTAQIEQLKSVSGPNDRYTVSVVNFDEEITHLIRCVPVEMLVSNRDDLYLFPRGNTALYDAIDKAISTAKFVELVDDGQAAFLISILTDGAENASKRVTQQSLSDSIARLTASGRYTFTYAGPAGSGYTAKLLGIPEGNHTVWEQSASGFKTLSATTRGSFYKYAESRSRGIMRSESFYAQPVTNDAEEFANKLDSKLDDVTSRVRVERVQAQDPLKIREFAKKKFGEFKAGEFYYELVESEKVQDYKGILVQDKTRGQFFSGWGSAKKLLGIPDFQGTVNIKPGSLGDFKVFVQSTSYTRKLKPGTAVVRLTA